MNESKRMLSVPATKSNRADLRKIRVRTLMAKGHTRAAAIKMAKEQIK